MLWDSHVYPQAGLFVTASRLHWILPRSITEWFTGTQNTHVACTPLNSACTARNEEKEALSLWYKWFLFSHAISRLLRLFLTLKLPWLIYLFTALEIKSFWVPLLCLAAYLPVDEHYGIFQICKPSRDIMMQRYHNIRSLSYFPQLKKEWASPPAKCY